MSFDDQKSLTSGHVLVYNIAQGGAQMATRKEKAAQTRQQIIEAALEMMRTKPIADVKVEDITEKAGVAKGTFYVHFKSKDDLLRQFEMDSMQYLLRYSVEHNESTETRILFYMRLYQKLMVDLSLELYKNVLKIELDAPQETLFRKNWETIKQIITNDGYADDEKTDMVVSNITAFLHGVILEWAIMEGKNVPDNVLTSHGEEMIRTLLSTLRKNIDVKE